MLLIALLSSHFPVSDLSLLSDFDNILSSLFSKRFFMTSAPVYKSPSGTVHEGISPFYGFAVKDLRGKPFDMNSLKGKVSTCWLLLLTSDTDILVVGCIGC